MGCNAIDNLLQWLKLFPNGWYWITTVETLTISQVLWVVVQDSIPSNIHIWNFTVCCSDMVNGHVNGNITTIPPWVTGSQPKMPGNKMPISCEKWPAKALYNHGQPLDHQRYETIIEPLNDYTGSITIINKWAKSNIGYTTMAITMNHYHYSTMIYPFYNHHYTYH